MSAMIYLGQPAITSHGAAVVIDWKLMGDGRLSEVTVRHDLTNIEMFFSPGNVLLVMPNVIAANMITTHEKPSKHGQPWKK